MSKRLFTTRALKGGIRRHTLANDVTVHRAQYAARLKKHFETPGKELLHILDCSKIRTIGPEVFEAIIEVHRQLVKRGHRLVISAGDDARRCLEYKNAFHPKEVWVYLTEEAAIRELRSGR